MSDAAADADRSTGLAAAADVLRGARSVWLGTHFNPDGDAIGSLLGLTRLLEAGGATVVAACQDAVPEDFFYLDGAARIHPAPLQAGVVAVAVDCGDLDRLGTIADVDLWSTASTVVLDHHRSNPGFGSINVIAPEVSSTSELVLELAGHLGTAVDTGTAEALLLGVVTDTLAFRTSSTTARTLDNVTTLVRAGADLPGAINRIYGTRRLSAVRLNARAVERLEVRGRAGVAVLTAEDLATLQEMPEDTRGISSFLLGARELDLVAVVREGADGKCDISMRSRPPLDLVPAVKNMGGGGHPQAAGALIDADLPTAVDRAWAALEAVAVAAG